MEGNPTHPQLFSERETLRDEQEVVEAIIAAQFENKEKLRENALQFFALETKEGEEILSENELREFGVFATHATKRIVRAESRKYDGKFGNSHLGAIANLSPHAEDPYLIGPLLHDIAHAAGLVLNGTVTETQDSLVPIFFRHEIKEDFNEREIMEEELWAYIFFKVGTGGTYGNFTRHILAETSSFEEFSSAFIMRCMTNIRRDNSSLFYQGELSEEEHRNRYTAPEEGEKIIESILQHPPELFLKTLHIIWENRNNPRVLAELFSHNVGPYIQKLKQRKTYQEKPKET